MDASQVESDLKILQYNIIYFFVTLTMQLKHHFFLDYDLVSTEQLKCTDPLIEYLHGIGRSTCIMRCNELANCNFLSSYRNKGCYLYETCNDKFTTPKKRKLYQKPTGTFLISKRCWNRLLLKYSITFCDIISLMLFIQAMSIMVQRCWG